MSSAYPMESTDSEPHEGSPWIQRAYTLDMRRRDALEEIDNAKFSFIHTRVCLVAGAGFFTDAYDIFAINIASVMIGYVYGKDQVLNPSQDLGIKVAAPVGTLVGQLLFGWLADHLGRKRMYGIELMIIITATFSQALSGGCHAVSIIGVLVVWRFILGIGIGGDYPLSAVISSEFASTRIRGRMMTAVFSTQGWGNFTAALVALIITTAYKSAILGDADVKHLDHVDFMWRLLIGLGCVPGAVALYFRLTITETPRFTMDIERNVLQASADIAYVMARGTRADHNTHFQRVNSPRATWADFRRYFGRWENMKVLLGTSYSWFAIDIAVYSLGLNSSDVLTTIGFGKVSNNGTQGVYDNLRNICVGNLILSAGGLLPGYYATFFLIDSWGRKPIQLMGFTVLTILFTVMGFSYEKLTATPETAKGFIVLFCLALFFQNFGPNTTTFIIPGEIFPTRYRSTAHGISAASGKLGAIIAQVGYEKLKDIHGTNKFVGHILEIIAFFMMTGILSTYFLLPETKNKTLEELSNEDQRGFVSGIIDMVEMEDTPRFPK